MKFILNGSQGKRAQPPLQPGKAQRWHGSGGSQRKRQGEGQGPLGRGHVSCCPSHQKVTWGTLLKVKEALWGDGAWGFPHWLPRIKLSPPFEPSSPCPHEHLGTGPVIHAHMDRSSRHTSVYRHTLFQEQRETELGEISRQLGDHALPRDSKLKIIQPPQGCRAHIHTPQPRHSASSFWGPL